MKQIIITTILVVLSMTSISQVKNKYTEWEANPKRFESGYDYEQTFAEMMQIVEKEAFKISVGKVSKDRNVKKNS